MGAERERATGALGNGNMRALAVFAMNEAMDSLAEMLHAAAEGLEKEDPRGAAHVSAAARMVEGVDRTADAEAYLKAVQWTLEQVSIELKDVTGGDGWEQHKDPE